MLQAERGGDVKINITDSASIKSALEQIGKLDAIISIAGEAKWASFDDLSEEDFYIGLKSKLMGQVNLVRIGKDYIKPSGSITLTTGILADDPVAKTTSAAMVNGALHSFLKAAVLEIRHDVRVNIVCPGLVEDSADKYRDYFPGYNPVSMEKVINAYVKSVMGRNTGEVFRVYE